MSSHDTISNTTSDRIEDFSQTLSAASFISNTLTLERTFTSEFAADLTMTPEFPENDPSANQSKVSSIERVELRPTRCRKPTTEHENNSRPNTTWTDTENATFPCDTPERAEEGSCKKVDTGTSSSLEKRHLWPILTSLQKNLAGSSDSEEGKADDIVHDLYVSFNSDPWEFTDHLLTIIEESSVLSMSGTSEASSSLLSRLEHTDSTQYMSLRGFKSNRAKGSDCSQSFVTPETPESSKAASPSAGKRNCTPMVINLKNKAFTKTAKVYGVPRTCETPESSISSVVFEECSSKNFDQAAYRQTPRLGREIRTKSSTHLTSVKTPGSSDRSRTFKENYSVASNSKNVSYLKVPRIILIPDTPSKDTSRIKKCSLENDPENTKFPETDEPKDETPDMSKVSSRHKDWGEAFESRKGRETAYITKFERRWLRQMVKNREKCYSTIMKLIENATVVKNEECTCDDCIVLTDFYKTMIVCDDYYISTNCVTDYRRRPEAREVKKNRRSVSGSRNSTNREAPSNSQTSGKSTKKVSRKSIGRKSPAGKSKSPRHNVVVKPNMRSPFRSKGSRPRPGPMSEIDRSSIRSVAQLRKVFSPGATKSGNSDTATKFSIAIHFSFKGKEVAIFSHIFMSNL